MPRTQSNRTRPPPPLPKLLDLLAEFKENDVEDLRIQLSSARGFDTTVQRCEMLYRHLGLESTRDAVDLVASLEYLYARARAWRSNGDDLKEALRRFFNLTGLYRHIDDNEESTLGKLVKLLEPIPSVDKLYKRNWLKHGILDNAMSFASFVDLRPDFSSDRKSIEELIPTIIFEVEVASQVGEEKTLVFQLTESALNKLNDCVLDVQKKLDLLRSDEKMKPLIYFDERNNDND